MYSVILISLLVSTQSFAGVCDRSAIMLRRLAQGKNAFDCSSVTRSDLVKYREFTVNELIPDLMGERRLMKSRDFVDFDNLTKLSLYYLRGDLPDDLLSPVRQLETLNIQFSNIPYLSSKLIAGNPKLISLQINTGLTKIPQNFFEHQTNLRYLKLWRNSLQVLGPNDFFGLKAIVSMDFKSNRIGKIHPDTFTSLKSLAYLGLSENLLNDLPLGLFRENAQLKTRMPN